MSGYAGRRQETQSDSTSTSTESSRNPGMGPGVGADVDAGAQGSETPMLDAAEESLEKVELAKGAQYTVTAEDMGGNAWDTISDAHGMSAADLMVFNQHVEGVGDGGAEGITGPVELAEGVKIYVPSVEELAFGVCRKQAESYGEAVELWGKISAGPNIKLIVAARERASGKVGKGYGTGGVDEGRFMTPNPDIAGASRRRTETHGGNTEYKVFWVPDFWKCSVYMHDVVWQAGYKPHLTANNHYQLAGRLHQSPMFTEVAAKDAMPGDCFQRFGGTRSNESHNAILSSFVNIESQDEEFDKWTFDILGAESDRAAESTRTHTMKKDTNENTSGKIVRFFRPKTKR